MTAHRFSPQPTPSLSKTSEPSLGHPDTLRTTQCGQIIGKLHRDKCHVWQGVPYAQPPVGALRWRAPQPPLAWSGIYPAFEAGSPCAQRNVYTASNPDTIAIIGNEDCLYLNIWAPPFRADSIPTGDERLPVMVWVHGGSNIRGQGGTYLGGTLAKAHNVIVVTFNYRLGPLGWFRHRALRALTNDVEDHSGNFGTLDIIAALRWVRTNIEAFGGDAEKVTLFGQSAGGWNVCSLLASPLASGLFQRAIVQSGSSISFDPVVSENYVDDNIAGNAQSSGEILLQLLIDDERAKNRSDAKELVMRMSDPHIADYLHKKSLEDFERAYKHIRARTGLSALEFPALFRDGAVLPAEGLEQAFASGTYCNKVPVIIGANKDEYTVLMTLLPDSPFSLHVPESPRVRIADKHQFYRAADYLSRLVNAFTVDELAHRLAYWQPNTVFAYRLEWDYLLPAPYLDNILLGATHGLDVVFVFGRDNLGPEFLHIPLISEKHLRSYQQLSDAMMAYWAQFAATGNPADSTNSMRPHWRPWSVAEGNTYFVLDDITKGGLRMNTSMLTKPHILQELSVDSDIISNDERCQFLRDLYRIAGRFSLFHRPDYENFCDGYCAEKFPL